MRKRKHEPQPGAKGPPPLICSFCRHQWTEEPPAGMAIFTRWNPQCPNYGRMVRKSA